MGSEDLDERFDHTIRKIGMPHLKHPIFYNAPSGLRFEIGGEEDVYLEADSPDELIPNPHYISNALKRAETIYSAMPHAPNILRIDTYPEEEGMFDNGEVSLEVLKKLQLPSHQLQISKEIKEDGDCFTRLQLYWDLSAFDFCPHMLLKEIIGADLGGISALASSVFFMNTDDAVLFHLYDDRGADLVAADQEILRPIFKKFNDWILEYDRGKIEKLFCGGI